MRNETYDKILKEARKRTLKERLKKATELILREEEQWTSEEAREYLEFIVEVWVEDGMPR